MRWITGLLSFGMMMLVVAVGVVFAGIAALQQGFT